MEKLILVRHGETEKNVVGKLHASGDQESLNKVGREQIEKTAERLKEYSPKKIFTSTEKRAVESAKILSKFLEVPYETVVGMQERNWGVFTGKPWDEVKVVLDPMSLEERYNYIPEGGESWKEFEERLIAAIDKIMSENQGKTVVAVSHGGAIRALMPYLLNVPKEESFKYDLDNASLTVFDHDHAGFK